MKNLFIFEMANNHNGSVQTAKSIIDGVVEITKNYNIDSAIKFQFRSENFIHKDYKDSDIKHVKRFIDTYLTPDQYEDLIEYAKEKELKVIVTPFDEESVERCMEVNIIKIASCSAEDWPLLEVISGMNKPIIISTGGLDISGVDNIVNYFTHKGSEFMLMHCIAEYPIIENFNMNYIDKMKRRYNLNIGYSGHEDPDNLDICKIAVAKGVNVFEKHIGIENLNSYSMSIRQADEWVKTILDAICICGNEDRNISQIEYDNIESLKRGVYAKTEIKKGDVIKDNVYFAFPKYKGCLNSGQVGKYRNKLTADTDIYIDRPVSAIDNIDYNIARLRMYVHRAKGMIMEAGISLGEAYEIELSHHYGIDKFDKYGAVIISLINREYCKKLIVMFPGQFHPIHHHKRKEETFHVLSGEITVDINGEKKLKAGDIFLIERYRDHSFYSDDGCIFEEISTTHIKGDSFYKDENIYKSDPFERKTIIEKL